MPTTQTKPSCWIPQRVTWTRSTLRILRAGEYPAHALRNPVQMGFRSHIGRDALMSILDMAS